MKRFSTFSFLKKEKLDIVALQESHISTNEEAHLWELQWGGKLFHSLGSSHSLGQITLVSKKLMDNTRCIYKDDRILLLEVTFGNQNIIIANIYAPQAVSEKVHFYTRIQHVIEEHNKDNLALILLGDFNSVLSNNEDIISGEKHNTREVESLNQLVTQLDLQDSWRIQHPDEKKYTWNRFHPFTARRIDYLLISSSLTANIEESEIISFPHSDHRVVTLSLILHNYKRGPSYWKFNNSLLRDTAYVNHMNNTITAFQQKNSSDLNINPHAKWELCKIKIREATIAYSKDKQRNKRSEYRETLEKLNELENTLKYQNNANFRAEIAKTKMKLELHAMSEAKGAQTRSRIKFIEDGEKNTAFFLNLEKRNAVNNTITTIKKEDGSIASSQKDVLAEQVNFYTELYKKDENLSNAHNTYITDFLGENCTIPRLNENERNTCEAPITETEISIAINKMKNGSAPGSDGLTAEFYKFFWTKIKPLLMTSYIYSFQNGQLSPTQQKGIITLIHKGKHLPRENLANWRPITLLNTDYKILAKTLALRLSTVITKLISEDQCGFIKGRNISTILRVIDDTVSHLNTENLPGILVGIDFAKAFDTISKTFIHDSIKMFGFGPEFQRCVSTLLTNTESAINHYGWISQSFQVERGIRQGCPLSPLLFVLAVELLAMKVRSSKIKGQRVNHSSTKTDLNELRVAIQQFADDTTLFLQDKEDLDIAMAIFQRFASISGLKMNRHKTQAMWLGRDKNNTQQYHNLKWVKQIKILGIHFKNHIEAQNIEENWEHKIDSMKRTISLWSRRNLSIYGKILIAKTFIISQFIYIMQSIGIPDNTLTRINRELFAFIWKKKYNNKKAFEKIKRKILTQDFDKGGLKMLDMKTLQEALYLTWVPKLVNRQEKQNTWKAYPLAVFSKLGLNLDILANPTAPTDLIGVPRNMHTFWRNVLLSWLRLRQKLWDRSDHIYLNSAIWNNSLFQYKHKNLYMKDWITKGIYKIKDILHNEDQMIPFTELEQKVGSSPSRLFEYNAVKTALDNIKQKCRLSLFDDIEQDAHSMTLQGRTLASMSAKHYRKLLHNDIQPCATNFWNRQLNIHLDDRYWKLAFDCTQETRLRVLHWKILHNIYPTNILLCKMGIAQTNKCNACAADETDYIEHFFFTCTKIKPLWKMVEQEITKRTDVHVKISKTVALLGYHEDTYTTQERKSINHLILIAKMCISKHRHTNSSNIEILFNKELALRTHLVM